MSAGQDAKGSGERVAVAMELLTTLATELGTQTGLKIHVTEVAGRNDNSRWRSPMPLPTMQWRKLALFRRARWCDEQSLQELELTRFIIPVFHENQTSLLLLRLVPKVACTHYAARPSVHPVSHMRPLVQHFVDLCHKRFSVWHKSTNSVTVIRTIERVDVCLARQTTTPGPEGESGDARVHDQLVAFVASQDLWAARAPCQTLVAQAQTCDAGAPRDAGDHLDAGCGHDGHVLEELDRVSEQQQRQQQQQQEGQEQRHEEEEEESVAADRVAEMGDVEAPAPCAVVFSDNLEWDDEDVETQVECNDWTRDREVTASRAPFGGFQRQEPESTNDKLSTKE